MKWDSSSTPSLKLMSGKMHELIYAKPIKMQIQEHGEEVIQNTVASWILKLCNAIGDNIDKNRIETLVTDLLEVYPYDSLEDVRECLKRARNGSYSFGHEKRGFVTMILIREWMSQFLEEKAIERERLHENKKKDIKQVEEKEFDPVKFYENGKIYREKIKEMESKRKLKKYRQVEYSEFRNNYLASKKRKKNHGKVN